MVIYYFVKTPSSHKTMKVALSLILAGAVGNLIDRVVRGSVIDFIEVHIRGFTWPTFNVADSCITVGASLLVLMLFIRRP
jgi:signal peptidase II